MTNFLFILFMISGISGKIQGIVRDDATQEPIPGADVVILNTDIGTATDENGQFFILNVPPGRYTVEISYIGFQSQRISNILVEIDQAVRLDISLEQTTIEMTPITVTSELPVVKKDMVGTTYIIRRNELPHMPIDYAVDLVTFQPAVARSDTAIYVRGGRATEVQYMIDNVPIIDPQTGDLAINISKGIVDEIIFLPGGFDAEYGRAMSGVINLITVFPKNTISARTYAKTERIMPFYYDFGYENYLASINLPVSDRFKGLVSLDMMHTDDWDPKLYILPHKQRDDYSLYGKWIYLPSGKLSFSLSGALSRTQFDRYNSEWKFNLNNYRSDLRTGNLQSLNISFLPNTRYLFNLTLSRLYTQRTYGVRDPGSYGRFDDFTFRDYATLVWPHAGIENPFGADYWAIICAGDYYEHQEKTTDIMRVNLGVNMQVHKYHEFRTGFEYTDQTFDNFSYFISDSNYQIIDEYQYHPNEYAWYIQDNIDYKGLYAKIGCRVDYFSKDPDVMIVPTVSNDTLTYELSFLTPTIALSPRVGFSFLVTDKFLLRANVGRYVQPPLRDYQYGYYSLLPFPSYLDVPPVGNPRLGPEKTISYEIGLQGEIKPDLNTTINTFYKDVSDLTGTRYIPALPAGYYMYFNVEYANIKGIETILEFTRAVFTGKISYTLSWARGTSSYAFEYADTSITQPAEEYDLDFDQRHRVFLQGIVRLPLKTQFYVFGYFGNGFPYTPPGPEGKYEDRNIERLTFQRQIDCVISKALTIGSFNLMVDFEIMNLLDHRYETASHFPVVPLALINMEDFEHGPPYIDIHNSYYSPAADLDHDGVVTPQEEYLSFRGLIEASDDWVNAYTSPRRARLGISLQFN
jgi:hypothetical protein